MTASSALENASSDVVARFRLVDEQAMRWVSTTDHGPLHPVVSGFARATDVLAPVLAGTAWLLGRGAHERSVVGRAWSAIALSAVAESLLIKPLAARGRPDPSRFPDGQRRVASPSTSAFPSGHLGAMAAFGVVTGRELPALRPWVAATLVATAYARIYTGRHYLTDTVAGMAVGGAIGLARSRPVDPGSAPRA